MIKILLIDDDEELCTELGQVLEGEGFFVGTAFDGLKGLLHLQEEEYQIIILDLKLPGLSGFEVLKDLRKVDKHGKVIVLSGKPILAKSLRNNDGLSQEEEEKVLGLADMVVSKPFRVEDFIERVNHLAASIVEKGQ